MNNITVWRSTVLDRLPWLEHAFTPAGYNMSTRRGPDQNGTPNRRSALCNALGIPANSLICGEQVHGADLACAEEIGPVEEGVCEIPGVDGITTRSAGLPLMARSADCPLITLVSNEHRAVGLAHAGWRGTASQMPRRLVEAMTKEHGVDPSAMVAVLAPSAQDCCYEVGEDVWRLIPAKVAQGAMCLRRAAGSTFLNLERWIANQLMETGIAPDAIHLSSHCTICDTRFHSYRRDGTETGLSALIVCRKA